MKIVVGLGNPGPRYETTRHNIGFLVVDRLVERWKADGPSSKNMSEQYGASFSGEKVLLVKPQTFMNISGRAVAPIMQFYKCEPSDLIVIHDDLDLPPLSLKIKTGGGTGGHNGLKSIDESLGGGQNGYHRVRVGIGHPRMTDRPRQPVEDYVLEIFSDEELGDLDQLLDRAADAVELLVKGDAAGAMRQFNQKEKSEE